jgi:hypothetical protein
MGWGGVGWGQQAAAPLFPTVCLPRKFLQSLPLASPASSCSPLARSQKHAPPCAGLPLPSTPTSQSLSNNYRRPVLGFSDDLQALGRREVADFFARWAASEGCTTAVAIISP